MVCVAGDSGMSWGAGAAGAGGQRGSEEQGGAGGSCNLDSLVR